MTLSDHDERTARIREQRVFAEVFEAAEVCASPAVEMEEIDLIPISDAKELPALFARLISQEYLGGLETVMSWVRKKYAGDARRFYAAQDKEGRVLAVIITNEYFELRYGWLAAATEVVEQAYKLAVDELEKQHASRATVQELDD